MTRIESTFSALKGKFTLLIRSFSGFAAIVFFLTACSVHDESFSKIHYDEKKTLADNLIAHIATCWAIPITLEDCSFSTTSCSSYLPTHQVIVLVDINKDGSLKHMALKREYQEYAKKNKSYALLAASALEAIKECQPYDFLPADKYEKWNKMEALFEVGSLPNKRGKHD